MKVNEIVQCLDFPCLDTQRAGYQIPAVELDPAAVKILLISEATPENPADYYYAGINALFARTTLLAFQEAGAKVACLQDILDLGVYLTTAVKCAKTGPGLASATSQNCSFLLEKEIGLFPNVKVFLLMGDVAIKAINAIARRNNEARVIPGFQHARHPVKRAGPAFFVEKSKRRMIAEDIRKALLIAN